MIWEGGRHTLALMFVVVVWFMHDAGVVVVDGGGTEEIIWETGVTDDTENPIVNGG